MATLVRRFVFLAAAATLLGLSVSCKGNTATVPTATLVTEDKSGSVAVGGTDTKTFTVTYSYDYSPAQVALKSLTSAATGAAVTTPIGLAFGSVNSFDGSCVRSTYATPNALVTDAPHATDAVFIGPNTFCIQVYDSGTLAEPVNYTITLQHY